jgi:hypothetical protein
MRAQLAVLGLLLSLPAAAADWPSCGLSTKAGITCSCDVRTLRPLQGAIGLEEVLAKKQKIADHPKREWRDLEEGPIKVIRGPGNGLYITDHHHGADAWRLAGKPIALCQIGKGPAFNTDAEFWSELERDHLVRLANAEGKPLMPAQLPQSLKLMPDDPYRSLAWLVRKNGGICRSEMKQKEFAEFVWADWLREQPELPAAAVGASAKKMLPKALELVRGPAAKEMDGYVGSKPPGFKCPKDL